MFKVNLISFLPAMRDGENGNDTSDNDETNDGNNDSDQTAVTCS